MGVTKSFDSRMFRDPVQVVKPPDNGNRRFVVLKEHDESVIDGEQFRVYGPPCGVFFSLPPPRDYRLVFSE